MSNFSSFCWKTALINSNKIQINSKIQRIYVLQWLYAFKALTLGVVTVLEVFLETIFMQNLASGVFPGFSCHIRHNPLISEIWIDIEHLWSRQMDKLSFNTNDYYSSALAFKIKMYQSSKERDKLGWFSFLCSTFLIWLNIGWDSPIWTTNIILNIQI